MRGVAAFALVLALAVSGSALAGRGEPEERLSAADQARAKAMLIRQADMGQFQAIPTAADPETPYCAALDESDLTLTGRANSPSFTAGTEFAASRAYVYASKADASASWRRGTSAGGRSCLRQALLRELSPNTIRLLSFKELTLPKLPVRSVAFRAIASRNGVRLYLDLIALQHGRAEASVVYGTALTLPPRSQEVKLARAVAARMIRALRGS